MVLPDESPAPSFKSLRDKFQSKIQQDTQPLLPTNSFGSAGKPRLSASTTATSTANETKRKSWVVGAPVAAAVPEPGGAGVGAHPAEPPVMDRPLVVTQPTLDAARASDTPSFPSSPSLRSSSLHAKEGLSEPPPPAILLEQGKLVAPPLEDAASPPLEPVHLDANWDKKLGRPTLVVDEGALISPLELSPKNDAVESTIPLELELEAEPEHAVEDLPGPATVVPPASSDLPPPSSTTSSGPRPTFNASLSSSSLSRRQSLTDPTASYLAKVRAPPSSRTTSPPHSHPTATGTPSSSPSATRTSTAAPSNTTRPKVPTTPSQTPTSSRIRSSTPSSSSHLHSKRTTTPNSTPKPRERSHSISSSTTSSSRVLRTSTPSSAVPSAGKPRSSIAIVGGVKRAVVPPTQGTPRSRAAAAAKQKKEEEEEREGIRGPLKGEEEKKNAGSRLVMKKESSLVKKKEKGVERDTVNGEGEGVAVGAEEEALGEIPDMEEEGMGDHQELVQV